MCRMVELVCNTLMTLILVGADFGRSVKNPSKLAPANSLLCEPPNLIPAEFNIIFKPTKLFPPNLFYFSKLTCAGSDTDSEWEDHSENFDSNAFDFKMDDELA